MIPYNPSSFDTNKTLLENILELKKWLQDHPSYEIYYSSANGDTTQQQSYNLNTITDYTNLEAGDVVIFNNVSLALVLSVDTDLGIFTCEIAKSFKGDTGAQGSQGVQGVSITNVSVDASNHLITTLSDGTSIDAGAIQYNNYITLTTTSGTLTDDEYNIALLEDSKIIYASGVSKQVYTKWYEDSSTIVYIMLYPDIYTYTKTNHFTITKSTKTYIRGTDALPIFYQNMKTATGTASDKILITDGNGGFNLMSNEGAYCLSTGQTSGKVLTSNGSGGASWENPSGSAVEGTDVLSTGETSGKVLMADGDNTSSWQDIPAQTPEGTTIKSTGETSGKVLTADGNGGASWQTVGGGSTLYRHSISLSTGSSYIRLDIINNDATSINSFALLRSYLDTNGFTNANNMLNVNGLFISSSKNYCVYGIIKSGLNIIAYGFDATQTSFGYGTIYTISSATINDFVLQIS